MARSDSQKTSAGLSQDLVAGVKRLHTTAAASAGRLATWASRVSGRGSGGMIGGLVAHALHPNILATLVEGKKVILITGTNGKSTTTKMVTSCLRRIAPVCTNSGGDNMDAGIIAALLADGSTDYVVLEVDELHVPHIADVTKPVGLVLLNLSRDQMDRCGEISHIEKVLRDTVNRHPQMHVVANCDDVAVTSIAFDAKKVTWVSTGRSWISDSVSCPRTGSYIVHDEDGGWHAKKPLADGRAFARPEPDVSVDEQGLTVHHNFVEPGVGGSLLPQQLPHTYELNLSLPGRANRGNAAQAFAAAVAIAGVTPVEALEALNQVEEVAGRYATINYRNWQVHMLLAKNPAGWQEALSMVDRSADGVVIAVNGEVADGVDLSWLWDVKFENFHDTTVVAAGKRGTDLSVRLTYAGIPHTLVHDTVAAIEKSPHGRVEVLANYTAFRDLKRALNAKNNPTQGDAAARTSAAATGAASTAGAGNPTASDSGSNRFGNNSYQEYLDGKAQQAADKSAADEAKSRLQRTVSDVVSKAQDNLGAVEALTVRAKRTAKEVKDFVADQVVEVKNARTTPAEKKANTPTHPSHQPATKRGTGAASSDDTNEQQ